MHLLKKQDDAMRNVTKFNLGLEGRIMGAIANALQEVNSQLSKAKDEIVGQITDLRTQLEEKGQLDQADLDALDALQATAQGLDDIVPDATTDPEPETPEEGEEPGEIVIENGTDSDIEAEVETGDPQV